MLQPIAILAALPLELRPLLSVFEPRDTVERAGIRLRLGTLHGREMALAVTGVGKVNAASATQMVIDACLPKAIVMVGTAGSLSSEVRVGDVVVATSVSQFDVGTIRAHKYTPLPVRVRTATALQEPTRVFPCCPQLTSASMALGTAITLPFSVGAPARVLSGRVLTGDPFVLWPEGLRWLAANLQAVAVEMEGGAVAQVAMANGVRFALIRGISDIAERLRDLGLEDVIALPKPRSWTEKTRQVWLRTRYAFGDPRTIGAKRAFRRGLVGAAANAAALVSQLVSSWPDDLGEST